MILPSLQAAVLDRRLSPTAFRVLALMHARLDLVRFRPMKAWTVAQVLGIDPHTAASALRHLVRTGYLDRGPLQARRVGTYRMMLSVELEPEDTLAIASQPLPPPSEIPL